VGFAVKVLVAIHYSVLAAKNWYTRNAVVACQGSMSKVAKSFIFRGCLNPVISAGRTSVDIRASAKLEYLILCAHGLYWSEDWRAIVLVSSVDSRTR